MVDATARFAAAAAALGVAVEPVAHPDGTRTAQDAAAAIGCHVDQIVKSLVVVVEREDGTTVPVVALTAGGNRIDLPALARLLGAVGARMADAAEARAATGFAIGGTPPFGHSTPVAICLDPNLTRFDVVWAAAGTPQTVFRTTPDALARAGAGIVGDFTA